MTLRLRRWITTTKFADFLWLQRLLCLLVGHGPQESQVTNPENGYCTWCMKYLPGKAEV